MMVKLKFKNCENVEYELIWQIPPESYNADGLCDSPEHEEPKILINPELKENRTLSVLIEEITHAFFWDIPEYQVRKFAPRLAKVIKKSGWHRQK
tara:strand:+ start:7081 stop:7365 length:285 start_codon:yes stop_codon:yes gene_type:complete